MRKENYILHPPFSGSEKLCKHRSAGALVTQVTPGDLIFGTKRECRVPAHSALISLLVLKRGVEYPPKNKLLVQILIAKTILSTGLGS